MTDSAQEINYTGLTSNSDGAGVSDNQVAQNKYLKLEDFDRLWRVINKYGTLKLDLFLRDAQQKRIKILKQQIIDKQSIIGPIPKARFKSFKYSISDEYRKQAQKQNTQQMFFDVQESIIQSVCRLLELDEQVYYRSQQEF